MRIFVASWFFPPTSSSEGNVTYKLLRNSQFEYVVCSSSSNRWSYKKQFDAEADNIVLHTIETDSFDEWIEEGVKLFLTLHAQEPFDAFMTRSMPPESIGFAQRLKAEQPDLPWIASLADPIAKSPFEIYSWIDHNCDLGPSEKEHFLKALSSGCNAWADDPNVHIRALVEAKVVEDYAIDNSDLLIFPSDTLKNYVLGTRRRPQVAAIPHSYDVALFGQTDNPPNPEYTTLTFLGHSDYFRSLDSLVEALRLLRNTDECALDKLRIRIIGNTVAELRTLVFNYHLHDVISIEQPVDYLESLAIMQQSDWLIHIDAHFNHMDNTGGSIFFAAKLADYMGTDAPILALTGKGSPADIITKAAGGLCHAQDDIVGIAQTLRDVATGTCQVQIDKVYRQNYDARIVSSLFDEKLRQVLSPQPGKRFEGRQWPAYYESNSGEQKLLTVCVPAFNVEMYLDRCLYSLVSCSQADCLEILVINDGSDDATREIALAYQSRYPSLIRLVDKPNGGHGSTINTALELASGKYFRVVDGDDWVDSNSLDLLLHNIRKTNLNTDLISSNYHQVYCLDGVMIPWNKAGEYTDYQEYSFQTDDFSGEYFTLASSMIKTELLQNAGFKIQEHTYFVDVEYILFPIPYIQSVAFTPESVYRYSVGNANQSINTELFVARYDHHDRVMRRMVDYFEETRPLMLPNQRAYMQDILVRHLLKNHYEISILYNPDALQGSNRAREFDAFLKSSSPLLYEELRKRNGMLRKLQKSNFSILEVQQANSLVYTPQRQSLIKKVQGARTGVIGNALARNRVAKSLYGKLRNNGENDI